jgi:NADP-dependent 3-hydroxy acid dehydrogenase YdfG
MRSGDVADAIVWVLTRPDRLFIGELVMRNTIDPWASG